MARKAKDGTEYTNQMSVNKHNMRMDAQKKGPASDQAPPDAEMQSDSQSQEDQAPDADSHVDALLDMGLSPDDIHEHAKKRAGMEQSQESEPAKASLSSIPGM